MAGINVAIIGISNPRCTVERVKLKAENYKITHNYENISEEKTQTLVENSQTKKDRF